MDIFVILWQLVLNAFDLVVAVLQLGLRWWLLLAWFGWWTFAVDWRRAWAYLGQGGWAPLVLIMLIGAFVWSRIEPAPYSFPGFMTVPNFWWQLGGVGLLVLVLGLGRRRSLRAPAGGFGFHSLFCVQGLISRYVSAN